MGLIDKLRRVGGIAKNRLASSVGALRAQARGLSVRVPRVLGLTARAARLTTPLGIGITAATFAPQIIRGVRVVGQALARGIAFFGGRQVVTAAGAGGFFGILAGRRKGEVTRPSDIQVDPRTPGGLRVDGRRPFEPKRPRRRAGLPRRRKPRTSGEIAAEQRRRKAEGRPPLTRKKAVAIRRRPRRRARIPTHRHRVVSVPTRRRARGRRRTHRSPRHRGHKRVSFTTADGRKVSFLANPKARHR